MKSVVRKICSAGKGYHRIINHRNNRATGHPTIEWRALRPGRRPALSEDSKKAIEKEAREEFKRKGALRDLAKSLQTIGESLHGEASDGLCDGDALRTVLEGNLPKNWPGETPRVYVTALASDKWKPRTFCLNEGTPEDRI